MWAKHLRSPWSLLAIVFLGGTFARLAHPQGLSAASANPAPSVACRIDLQASRIYAKAGAVVRFGRAHAIEGRLASGSLALGGRGEVVLDLEGLLVDTPEARQYVGLSGSVSEAERQVATTLLRRNEILNVTRYPRATYAIESIKPREGQAPGAPGRYRLAGHLSLHGVRRPVPMLGLLEMTATPGVLRLRVSISILQSDFGIRPAAGPGGTPPVSDRVDIWGDLLLRPAG